MLITDLPVKNIILIDDLDNKTSFTNKIVLANKSNIKIIKINQDNEYLESKYNDVDKGDIDKESEINTDTDIDTDIDIDIDIDTDIDIEKFEKTTGIFKFSVQSYHKLSNYEREKLKNIFDKDIIKKELLDYKLYIQDNSNLKKIVNKYMFDSPGELILNLLFIKKINYVNEIDAKYFSDIKYVSLITKHVDKFTIKKLSEIVLKIYEKNSEIKLALISYFTYDFSVKSINFNKKFFINYLIDISGLNDYPTIKGLPLSISYIVDNINIDYELEYYNIKNNNKLKNNNLFILLDTTDEKIINYLIKKFKPVQIITSLEKVLNKKNKNITENIVYKILSYYEKKKIFTYRNINKYPIFVDKLINCQYYECVNFFKNNLYHIYDNKSLINIFSSGDINKIKYLIEDDIMLEIVNNSFEIWDFVLAKDELTNLFIEKRIYIPRDYFDYTFPIKKNPFKNGNTQDFFYKNIILKLYGKNNEKPYEELKNNLIKNFILNIKKFDVPLDNALICNFFNYLTVDEIIKYYEKHSDPDDLIIRLLYFEKYTIIDKLLEKNVLTLDEYKNKFRQYINRIGGKYYIKTRSDKIFRICKYNIEKYDINLKNFLIKIALDVENTKIIKYLSKKYKKLKLSENKIIQSITSKNYYYNRYKKNKMSKIHFLETIKPFVKNFKKIIEDNSVIKIISLDCSNGLEKIKKLKTYFPNIKLCLSELNYIYGNEYYPILMYYFEEQLDETKKDEDKIFYEIEPSKIPNLFSEFDDYLFRKIINSNFTELVIKYFDKKNLLNIFTKESIYQFISQNYYCTLSMIKFFEKIGFLKIDNYFITFIICYLYSINESGNQNNIITYCLNKNPFIKIKTYNYLKDKLTYFKNELASIKKTKSNYYKLSVKKNLNYLTMILDSIKEENIIYPDNPLYNEKENITNISQIKNIFNDYLFDHINKTDENNIIDEL